MSAVWRLDGSSWLYDRRMPTTVPVKDRPVFSLRVLPDVYDALDEMATKERRSLNNLTNILLEEALAARGVALERDA